MSTHILSACWALSGMSSTQKLVLISLADQANDDGVCWPSVPRMVERTCLSERAIRNAIEWLEAEGYLAGVFVVVDVGDVVKLKCWCRGRNQSSKQRQHTA